MTRWKARLGILSPSVFEIPSDWSLVLPSGFTLVATGLNVRSHTPDEFEKAVQALEETLSVFVAEEVDAVVLSGIAVATRRGYRAECEMLAAASQRLALPITSALSAEVEALKRLGGSNILIATAYREEINRDLERYFREAGFKIAGIKGLGVSRPVDQVKLKDGASREAALSLFREHPEADAVLVHGRWRSIAYVEDLEKEMDRPVVAGVAASLWWVLRTLKMEIAIEGYGRLLRGQG